MRTLIKLGGTLLDAADSRDRLAQELALRRDGHEFVVVHGGGKQMTRYLAEHGIQSRFVDGLRVTTPEILDAVLKVFAGSVNHELVAALVRAGSQAVGLSGIDGCLTEAEPLRQDLGAVGRPVRANTRLLEVLAGAGFLPVVACVAGDRQGRIYNVNADQMAVACAAGWAADRLLFLTDVEGVRGADGETLASLTSAACDKLIRDGVASGGMQAKLTAACDALRAGVAQIVIAPGAAPNIIQRLMAGEAVGTRITTEPGP